MSCAHFSCVLLLLSLVVGHPALVNAAEGGALKEEFGSHQPKATFYDEDYFNGSSTTADLPVGTSCRNLPRRWRGRPLSVDTSGTCISVCPAVDCGGDCVRVYPNNGDLQLAKVGMNRKVSSLKSCF